MIWRRMRTTWSLRNPSALKTCRLSSAIRHSWTCWQSVMARSKLGLNRVNNHHHSNISKKRKRMMLLSWLLWAISKQTNPKINPQNLRWLKKTLTSRVRKSKFWIDWLGALRISSRSICRQWSTLTTMRKSTLTRRSWSSIFSGLRRQICSISTCAKMTKSSLKSWKKNRMLESLRCARNCKIRRTTSKLLRSLKH